MDTTIVQPTASPVRCAPVEWAGQFRQSSGIGIQGDIQVVGFLSQPTPQLIVLIGGVTKEYNTELWVTPVNGKAAKRVVSEKGIQITTVLPSPDQKQLLYTTRLRNRSSWDPAASVKVADLASAAVRILVEGVAEPVARWMPDSKRVLVGALAQQRDSATAGAQRRSPLAARVFTASVAATAPGGQSAAADTIASSQANVPFEKVLAVSPVGGLAAGPEAGRLTILNTATGEKWPVDPLPFHLVEMASWSPDGRWLYIHGRNLPPDFSHAALVDGVSRSVVSLDAAVAQLPVPPSIKRIAAAEWMPGPTPKILLMVANPGIAGSIPPAETPVPVSSWLLFDATTKAFRVVEGLPTNRGGTPIILWSPDGRYVQISESEGKGLYQVGN